MGVKEFLQKVGKTLATPKHDEQGRKILPEEMELNTYHEQERRDKLRALVHEKRKQHNQMFSYKPNYNYNKDVKPMFGKPNKINKPKGSEKNLYFKYHNKTSKRNDNLYFG